VSEKGVNEMNSSPLHLRLVVLLVLALVSTTTVFTQSGGAYELKRSVIAGGGNSTSGAGNLQLVGTTGQLAAGTKMSAGTFTQVGGFWHGVAGNAPTDLGLSETRVSDQSPLGTVVGEFSTVDADASDGFTYTLVDGEGSNDNGSFTISNNELKTGAILQVGSYSIRVRTTDSTGLFFEKQFTVNAMRFGSAGILQFSSANYSVSEGADSAVIFITRTGGSGSIMLTFSTSDGTAGASDYTPVSQTVTFTAGETVKIVNVPITNDLLHEPDETVNLSITGITDLRNPGNSPSSLDILNAVLTIVDDDPISGTISFSQPNYSVTETGPGFIDITVSRTGDLSVPATVDYATSDDSDSLTAAPCAVTIGLASSRCDFTTALGTLRFAPGESSKTFPVLISQDSYLEGPEVLTLTLSNVVGSTLGARTASLMITDDNLEPADNPIDDPTNFVRQHYHDFLNREPDPAGWAFWTNEITSCGSDAECIERKRIHVSGAFFLSIEFQHTGYLVERFYKTAYGDLIGTSTLGGGRQIAAPIVKLDDFLLDSQRIGRNVVVNQPGWQAILEANTRDYAEEFVKRGRFVAEYPLSMTAGQYVDKLNANTGNCLTERQRDGLVEDLGTRFKTRGQVLREIAENQLLNKAEFNKAFVLMQYFGYLRRHPNSAPDGDFTGFDFWLTKMNQFTGNFVDAEMVKAFILSSEYRLRFDQ
jgi:hypothetical protein